MKIVKSEKQLIMIGSIKNVMRYLNTYYKIFGNCTVAEMLEIITDKKPEKLHKGG